MYCIEWLLQILIIVQFSQASTSMDDYLTHYWPFSNGQMIDLVANAHMTQGDRTQFTTDRFGSRNSALNLNFGWTQVPSGIYFDAPQFTISAWVYPQSSGEYARLIDFGNGPGNNNIVVSLDTVDSKISQVAICGSSNCLFLLTSSVAFTISQWTLIAVTFDGSFLKIYINGVLTGALSASYNLPTLTRMNNYIGRTNWNSGGNSNTIIDDLRFYNISLSQIEINDLLIKTDDYLTHYWPISNCNMNDLVGSAHMSFETSTLFVSDRFGNSFSALNLNGGWTQVPSGIYFDAPQFTITAWVYPQGLSNYSRLIDFGNGAELDNIVLTLTQEPFIFVLNGATQLNVATSSSPLIEQTWQFLAATFDGLTINIYINAILKGSIPQIYALPTLNRHFNFIGKSNLADNKGVSYSYIDQLRFYNKSLTRFDLYNLMNLDNFETDNSDCTQSK